MALDVHVAGPGLDVIRRLERGQPALILGRDSDCAICLPDAGRSVSRHHLSVWNAGDRLHFHVLSVVNGVLTGAGALPPGARGVLDPGDSITLAAFRVSASLVRAAGGPAFMDSWGELQHAAERLGPEATAATVPGGKEDDPFSDWGFLSSFGASTVGAEQGDAPAVDLQPFFTGLGVDTAGLRAPTQAELERIGRIARIAVLALLQVGQAAAAGRRELRVEDPSAGKGRPNPLRVDAPLQDQLAYLFGANPAAGGSLSPERALTLLAAGLAAHEQAIGPALRDTLRSVLLEFDPESLKKRVPGGGPRFFGAAQAWKAFVGEHAHHMAAQAAWEQLLLDRYFARAYARAVVRAKRNSQAPPGR